MIPRKRSSAVESRDAELLPLIDKMKQEHPFWGYRRIWANLRFKHGLEVNQKRVLRILREHKLLVNRVEYKAKRTNNRPKPRASRSGEWWGIDMTKILTNSGWAYLVVVLDWYTKKIVGYSCESHSRSSEWLEALNMGINAQFPDGVRDKGLRLMSDNGCQPTSVRFMSECGILGVEQVFTSYNNPKGNADTERMIRTIKEELIWLNEYEDIWELKTALKSWISSYNREYLHSALGWMTPEQFEEKTLLTLA